MDSGSDVLHRVKKKINFVVKCLEIWDYWHLKMFKIKIYED